MIKKILLGIVFAVLFCLTSCSNLVKDCSSQKKLLDNYNFGVYSDISESFSEILKNQEIFFLLILTIMIPIIFLILKMVCPLLFFLLKMGI